MMSPDDRDLLLDAIHRSRTIVYGSASVTEGIDYLTLQIAQAIARNDPTFDQIAFLTEAGVDPELFSHH